MKKISIVLLAFLLLVCALPTFGAISHQDVYFDVPNELITEAIPSPTAQLSNLAGYPDDANRLTLVARLYEPDPNAHGIGPYPAVVFLHGSGGVWSNDLISSGLSSQFREWGELLAGMGYLALFPDSYNPRGIPGNFASRRPHHDPAIDDHVCSPNYERPKDVAAALAFLSGVADFDGENVALIGFSHGAQTGINAVLDPSVDLGNYTVSYIDDQEATILKPVPSPVRLSGNLPMPKVCAFFYGGGSHYRYHGSASSVAAGRYMFHRDTRVLLFHGTEDSLLGVDDPSAMPPFTGDFYPIKQALASTAQAAVVGVADPLQHHFLLNGVGHSFDGETLAAENDWNTQNESADQKAKRLCREEVLKWLEACLKPRSALSIEEGPTPEQFTVRAGTLTRLLYQWRESGDLINWTDHQSEFDGTGGDATSDVMKLTPDRRFFQIRRRPVPPPIGAPENMGFFIDYSDFGF